MRSLLANNNNNNNLSTASLVPVDTLNTNFTLSKKDADKVKLEPDIDEEMRTDVKALALARNQLTRSLFEEDSEEDSEEEEEEEEEEYRILSSLYSGQELQYHRNLLALREIYEYHPRHLAEIEEVKSLIIKYETK